MLFWTLNTLFDTIVVAGIKMSSFVHTDASVCHFLVHTEALVIQTAANVSYAGSHV